MPSDEKKTFKLHSIQLVREMRIAGSQRTQISTSMQDLKLEEMAGGKFKVSGVNDNSYEVIQPAGVASVRYTAEES